MASLAELLAGLGVTGVLPVPGKTPLPAPPVPGITRLPGITQMTRDRVAGVPERLLRTRSRSSMPWRTKPTPWSNGFIIGGS